jgi:hypothetical protein
MPTYEEMKEWKEKYKKEREEINEKVEEIKQKDREGMGIKPFDESKIPKRRCDHPNTIENSTATVLWIAAMFIGSIFNDKWIIWVIVTIIWIKFITRYKK